MPGLGFAIGEDRLMLLVEQAGRVKSESALTAYVAWLGEETLAPAAQLARELRREGFAVEVGYEPVKLKKSLGIANKMGARFAVIIGDGELQTGRYQIKDMRSGEQQEVEPARIAEYLNQKLNADEESVGERQGTPSGVPN